MQFDQHGNRIWRQAQALVDSEHDDRLCAREPVLAATKIDRKARTEVMPSEEEIHRTCRLIN
jgi:hypothetical protein